MKRSLTLLCGALLQIMSFHAHAQEVQSITKPDATEEKDMKKMDARYTGPLFQRPLAIGLQLGTQGFGLEGRLGIHPRWNIRFGGDYLPGNYSKVADMADMHAKLIFDAAFFNLHLLADWKPFPGSGFRLTGGLAYFVNGEAKIRSVPNGNFKYGDITVSAETIGELEIQSDWKGIAPYLGLGLFKDFPKRKFNVNLDLGTYYLSKPKVDLTATKLLEENEDNQAVIEDNLKGYRWLPVLQLNFNYKLN